jgi:peptidyl-prolyl cis-trans isomerase SurA
MHRIHSVLKNGGEFEDLVKAHSEDKNTKAGGVLPYWVSTGQTNDLFEDAAFALKYPGDFTEVVEAPYGFHIIKLVDKHDKPDYNRWMPQIQTRIRMDERALIVRKSFINKTKKEYRLADSLTDKEVLEYANANLETKYPEFALLMQEYRDGILLFNISKDLIWDKASKDEAKLKEFYEKGNFDKPYNKVRGIIISKYQDELEKEWVKELREKYTITVNEKVLNSIK